MTTDLSGATKLFARQKHEFDPGSGTQEVFRLLLDTFANPGRSVDLSVQFSQFASNGMWLALALTLLDNETGFFWDGPPELAEEIQFLSGSAQVPLESADFVFLSLSCINTGFEAVRFFAEQVLSRVKAGTHRDPHNSALIVIEAGGKPEQSLSVDINGPGVPPGGRKVLLSAKEAAWIKARDIQQFEYPRGVEMIFVRDDNSLLTITRKAAVTWPM